MASIKFTHPDGQVQAVEADEGASAMRSALLGGISGIAADCGGEVSCATCHVYVGEEWTGKVGEPSLDEEDMLEFTASECLPNSRLSCQIEMSEELDGLELTIPAEQ